MNILQRIFNIKAASVVNTDFYKGMYQFIGNNSPVWIDQNNEAYISQGFAKNADVFSIVNYIIKRASTIPWKLYNFNGKGELTEIKNHPLINLIERPNPMMGQSFFIQALFGNKLILGNAFIYLPKLENGANKGKAQEMWVIPSSRLEIVSNGFATPVDHYRFIGTTEPKFKPEDIIHLKYINIDSTNGHASDLMGMSPLKPGSMALTQSNDGYTANVKNLQNMGAIGILSKKADSTKGNTTFTEEQASFIRTWWQNNYTGAHNAGKIHITSAQLEFLKMGLSPVDLNILESLKLSFRQLCNLYQFPSQLLNDNEHATYNNIREAKKALYTDVIIPELHSLRDELNRQLVPAYGDNLYLDIDISGIEVLQDDKKAVAEWLDKAWWIKGIDKQRIMGVTEDPDMDKYFIPGNLLASDTPMDLPEDLQKLLKQRGISEYE